LAHTFRVARDLGIILWTAKVPFPVELLSIRPVHEKAIFHQLIRRTANFWIADDSPSISLEVGNRLYQPI
jgi:hypothetical protein